jgi:hypothetical protein
VEIKEAFIDFIPLDVKTAEMITAEITKKLERDGLNLEDCRGQPYDNQATMAGVYSGVQKRILDLNPLAVLLFPATITLSICILYLKKLLSFLEISFIW